MRDLTGVAALLFLGVCDASEWPSFRGGPTNEGWVDLRSLPAPADSWTFRPSEEIRSYANQTGVFGSPAVGAVDGRAVLFVGCYDHNIYAVDIATGAERWRRSTGGPVYGTPCVFELPSGPVLFVGSSDRTLHALDARDGAKLWARELTRWRASVGRASLASPAAFDFDGRPAVLLCAWVYDRSAVNPIEEASALAYDAETGRLLWKLRLGTSALASPTVFRHGGRSLAIVGGADGKLWGLDLARGEVLWRRVLRGEIVGSAAIAETDTTEAGERSGARSGPIAFIGTRYGQLHTLDALTGRSLRSFRARRGIDSSPAIAEIDGILTVLFGSHDQSLYALAALTGDPLWRFHTRGDVYSSPAVFRSGGRDLVAFASGDDRLYLLDAATGTEIRSVSPGRYMWGYRVVGDSIWSSPVVVRLSGSDVILLPFYDGAVHAYPVERASADRPLADPRYGKQMVARAALIMVGTLALCLWLTRRRAA